MRAALDPQQRHQGEDAAFAVIVDPHGDGDVFDAGDRDQRPHDQRQDPEHRRRAAVAGEVQHRLERVERAGADVAEHHSECRKSQRRYATGRSRITFLHRAKIEPPLLKYQWLTARTPHPRRNC
jgi:hypothetical protein